MLDLGGHYVPGLLENRLVVPMRIQGQQFAGDRVVLTYHDQVERRQVHVFVRPSVPCT